jgi:hypothetical protein
MVGRILSLIDFRAPQNVPQEQQIVVPQFAPGTSRVHAARRAMVPVLAVELVTLRRIRSGGLAAICSPGLRSSLLRLTTVPAASPS